MTTGAMTMGAPLPPPPQPIPGLLQLKKTNKHIITAIHEIHDEESQQLGFSDDILLCVRTNLNAPTIAPVARANCIVQAKGCGRRFGNCWQIGVQGQRVRNVWGRSYPQCLAGGQEGSAHGWLGLSRCKAWARWGCEGAGAAARPKHRMTGWGWTCAVR